MWRRHLSGLFVKQETAVELLRSLVGSEMCIRDGLKACIDVLWLGARTTVNPFSVQEVADALSGADVPVLIKNPINPDMGLWVGAVERIYKAGITLSRIHSGRCRRRGYFSFQSSPAPDLEHV